MADDIVTKTKTYTDKVRTAMYGKEVRSSIADSIDGIAQNVKEEIARDELSNDVNALKSDLSDVTRIDYGTLVANTYISFNSGNATTHESYSCTKMIDISRCGLIKIKTTYADGAGYAFYDKNANFISGGKNDGYVFTNFIKVNVPTNAKYLRVSHLNEAPILEIYGVLKAIAKDDNVDTFLGNLFDKKNIIIGKSLNWDNTLSDNASFSVSNYVKVEPGGTVYRNSWNDEPLCCYYDENFKYLGVFPNGWVKSSESISPLDIPSNAYYIRFNIPNVYVNIAMISNSKNIISDYGYLDAKNYITEDEIAKKIEDATNPLSKIANINMIKIFRKIGVIGDSLSSGEMVSGSEGSYGYNDMFDLSWIQQLSRLYGFTGYNFSRGGLNTHSWLTEYNTSEKFAENLCDAYIIALGVNDEIAKINVGTSDDINLSDRTLNANTYYGNYGSIIQLIKEKQPKAKIFVITNPFGNDPYNNAVRDMANIFNNVYVIDLFKYAASIYKKIWEDNTLVYGNHLTATGYLVSAEHIATYIDWIIRNNLSEFKEVQFIGENLHID